MNHFAPIVDEQINGLKVISLNRPKALNSLNFEMVFKLHVLLEEAKLNNSIKSIFLTSNDNKAFCAGGDIKIAREAALQYQAGRTKIDDAAEFFKLEYDLNKLLYRFEKPVISYMEGITMGGGVGLAGPARYRICTPNTKWAMPEVNIGFFPDVGAAHYLAAAPHGIGYYAGLTGNTITDPHTLLKAGFATHYIDRPKGEIIAALAAADSETIPDVINNLSTGVENKNIYNYQLFEVFNSSKTLTESFEKLSDMGHEGQALAADIQSKSPLAVNVAFAHIKAAEQGGFNSVIDRDYKLAARFMAERDFVEGIRAQVVDKDKNPQWQPRPWGDLKGYEDLF